MNRPLRSWIVAVAVVVLGFAASADQQHRPFAGPAAAYAPLFGECAEAATIDYFLINSYTSQQPSLVS
jgi:hypothetical protein